MATTTNYSWTTPDNTAYVKDGASAIRTLGSSVDTTLFSVTGGKTVAYQLLSSGTVTTASEIILDFASASYKNYRIVLSGTTSAQQGSVALQFRNGSGNVTAANYFNASIQNATNSTSPAGAGNTGLTSSNCITGGNSGFNGVVDIHGTLTNPTFTARSTHLFDGAAMGNVSFAGAYNGTISGSLVGFRLVMGSGTLTANYAIYGAK